jgi:ABC-type nickel/cobalt efflux system permease component RcnA
MTDFHTLLQGGNAWLFIPSAILLGALHGLEPGHSKTMMAAFIIAVRGTLAQAVLLGLAATVSHTAIVWLIALGGMYFGQQWSGEASEPYMQVISAVLIIGVALWMMWRTKQNKAACFHDHGGGDGQGLDHSDHAHEHAHAKAPAHDAHGHDPAHRAACTHDHGHQDAHADAPAEPAFQDDHERAHAQQIDSRFANRHVTTGQIVMFGLTGGLIPCPASITVLLLCLQLKKIALGAVLVLGFSVGLALTMVAAGVVAALSVKHLAKRANESSRFSELARNAPYLSGALMLVVGVYVGWQGLHVLL